jgi:hypothetical protein
MNEYKKGLLPMSHDISLSKTHSRMVVIPYSLAVGSIIYAMICTRRGKSDLKSMAIATRVKS